MNDLSGINLQEVDLGGLNFANADLTNADLRGSRFDDTTKWVNDKRMLFTTLPDGNKWTPETDMTRFTNSDHPEFWRSNVED